MSQLGLFVIIATAFGYMAYRRKTAVVAAVTVLVVMCLVYYAPYASSFLTYLGNAFIWIVLSFISGPVFGILGNMMRHSNKQGAIAAAVVIGLLVGEIIRMSQKGLQQGDLPLLSLVIVFNTLAAITLLALLRPAHLKNVLLFAIPATAFGYLITYVLR